MINKNKKTIRQKILEEDIEFFRYLKKDLGYKFRCMPSKLLIINSMIDDNIRLFKKEIKKEELKRRK